MKWSSRLARENLSRFLGPAFRLAWVEGFADSLATDPDRQAAETNMKTPSLPDETPVKDGAANLQRGIETVGGWLYLTNRRLIFESHAFNIQTGATIIPLANIAGARKSWTKFLNLIPVFPNSVAVSTKEDKQYRFVTFGREAWIEAIGEARRAKE
jgi:hypothetical protein